MYTSILASISILLVSIVSSAPHGDVAKPHQLSKRTLPDFEDWSNGDPIQKQNLQNALQDSLDLVSRVAQNYGKYKPIWDKYFPEADHDKVKGVWNQIMSDPTNPGTGEDRLQYCIIIGEDIAKGNAGGDPCAEGAAAYTVNVPPDLLPPGGPSTTTVSYYCPPAFQTALKYSDIKCADLGNTMTTDMDFLGATIMHEWMHNDAIGAAATGNHIIDVNGEAGYGPAAVRNLLINTPTECVNNADSYTWLALEVFWTQLCLGNTIPFYKDPAGVVQPPAPPPQPVAPAPAPAPVSPSPPPPYATGTCSFHLTETQDCDSNYDNNLYASVKMYDNDKNVIGQTPTDNDHPIGYAMDDGNSYGFISKLTDPLVITGEHENDYVQFTIGALSWQSKSPNGGASCTVGGWDPRDGPVCGSWYGDQFAVNNMDCSFPC
ncbi:hypothetical protein P7C71_g1466, partial [Lecanoromycetidae sp. Uapishka_2]